MPPNAFIGKASAPTDADLSAVLDVARPVWDQLLEELDQEFGVNTHEWNTYSLKAGWSLRAKRKERTIVWLGPRKGCFVAAFILGDKSMQAARAGRLPQRIVRAMGAAPKYSEGTGIRITVKTAKDLAAIKMLAAIKIAN